MFELLNKAKYSTRCPKCADDRTKTHTQSLMVYRDKDGYDRWECMHPSCEWNTRQFKKRVEELDLSKEWDESSEDVAVGSNIEVPNHINGDRIFWYRDAEGLPLYGKRRIDYVDHETGKTSKTYRPVRIENGQIILENTRYPKNKQMYNLQDVSKHDKVIIVEGEKAAEAGKEIFKQAATVTWMGGASNLNQVDWSALTHKDVYVWPDNDEAGHRAMKLIGEALPLLSYKLLKVDHLPPKSDLADNLSKEDIEEAFRGAVTVDKFSHRRMTRQGILDQMKLLGTRKETSIPWIDDGIKFPSSGVVVVEGRTGHGKTAVGLYISNAMLSLGQRVLYVSYEVPAWEIADRLATLNNKSEVSTVSPLLTESGEGVLDELQSNFILFDQEKPIQGDELVSLLDNDAWFGSTVVIDNIQLVPVPRNDRFLSLKTIIEQLRDVSHRRGIVVILLSQLTPHEGNPMLDAPRECREIHNTASVVLRVWNRSAEPWVEHPVYDKLEGDFYIQVIKSRASKTRDVMTFEFTSGAVLSFLRAINGNELRVRKRTKTTEDEITKTDLTALIKSIDGLAKGLLNQHEAF